MASMTTCKACAKQMEQRAKTCPSCGAPNKRSRAALWIALSVAALAIIVAGSKRERERGGASPAKTEAPATNKPAAIAPLKDDLMSGVPVDVGLGELYSAYAANEIAADAKYKGKVLRVSGIVGRVGKDYDDKPFVALQRGREIDGLRVRLDTEAGLTELRPYQKVVMRCRGGNSLGEPTLSDCVLDPTANGIEAVESRLSAFTGAYGSWLLANPKRVCPAGIADLIAHMKSKDTNDPWGQPYRMLCDGGRLPGSRLRVLSNGPDQKPDTADDVSIKT